MMFYLYCVKLGRPESEFWESRFGKILKMIDIKADEDRIKAAAMNNEPYNSKYFSEQPQEIHSMKEIEGFI